MNNRLEKIFKESLHQDEQNLSSAIWQAILKKESSKKKILISANAVVGTLSLTALVFVVRDALMQFSQSGFYDYFSLLSSDRAVVATYWKEFTLSLTESLPFTSITISLLLLFILFVSLKTVTRQYKNRLLTA